MEAGGLGSMLVDQYRLGAAAGGLSKSVNQAQDAVNSGRNFAEILKKTAAPHEGASGEPAKNRTVTIDKNDKLYEQCLELEIFLVKTLISSMRSTVQKSGLVDEGFAGKMYEDMLYDEYARDFTKNAQFGMAEQAYLELSGQRGKVLIR
jgi:flagellar protein FlgJ